MDSGDQYILVVRAIENADPPLWRGVRMYSPEKIMFELNRGRLLEAYHRCSLRIESGEDMIDRAVLAARVQGLQDDQNGVFLLGIEQGLHLAKLLAVVLQFLRRRLMGLVMALEGRIDVLET